MTSRTRAVAALTAATLLIGAGAATAYQGPGRAPGAGAGGAAWSAGGRSALACGAGQARRVSTTTTITSAERATLRWMRQEEKLARDVYLELAERSALPALDRIATSEQRHMDSVGAVLQRHGIPDPVAGMARGEFADPAFEALYRELVAQGSASDAAAVAVGLRIERMDIADLDDALATATSRDVVRVLTALRAGSLNHLAAFTALS